MGRKKGEGTIYTSPRLGPRCGSTVPSQVLIDVPVLDPNLDAFGVCGLGCAVLRFETDTWETRLSKVYWKWVMKKS